MKQQLFIGAALIAGVAIGYFAAPQKELLPAATEAEVRVPRATIPEVKDAGKLAALRARVHELEEQLAKQSAMPVKEASEQGSRENGTKLFNSRSRKEWVENLKKHNPQAYVAMTNGIAQANRERQERHQRKLDFFSSIDVSGMSPAARKTHTHLQALIVKRESMDEGMDWENMSTEDMSAYHKQRREIEGEIAELSEVERKNLLTEAAKELGFQGEGADGFAETIKEIYEATDTPQWWRNHGRGRNGGRRDGRGSGPR